MWVGSLVYILFFRDILDNANEQHPEVFKPERVYMPNQFIPFPLGKFTNLIKYISNASGFIDFHYCRSYLLGRLQPCWSGYLDCLTHLSAFKHHRRCRYFLVWLGFNGMDECHRSAYFWLKTKDVPFFFLPWAVIHSHFPTNWTKWGTCLDRCSGPFGKQEVISSFPVGE